MTFPYTHITTLYSSAAVAWLFLGLLMCALGAYVAYPPYWKDCLTAVFSKIMRRYTDTAKWQPIILSHLFLIGTLSLSFSIALYQVNMPLGYMMTGMAIIIGLWLLLRLLIARWLGYIFSIPHEAGAIQEDSVSLMMVGSILLYLICCLEILFPNPALTHVLFGIVVCLYVVAMGIKVFISYVRSLQTLVYVLLYIVTFEIIPLGALYRASVHLARLIS